MSPVRMATLASENPERHAPGLVRPPRPLGARPGYAWEPREPVRSHAKANLTAALLERLEVAPGLQDVLVAALSVLHGRPGRGDAPAPPDSPNPPGAWQFAAIGDYGAGTEHLRRVVGNISRSAAELVVTTGDNVYPTGRWADYQRNWEPYVGPLARSRPFMPALGNHDMYRDDLRPYFGHFPHLNGLTYYSYVHRNAQFYALDSDQDLRAGSAQRRWLEHELKRSGSRWKVVYLHYPMYGSDKGAYDEIRKSLEPLLRRYGVQVVIAGHEHNYLRSHAIQGTVHLLTGGGGQRVYPFTGPQPPWIARRAAAYHHLEFAVGTDRMVVRAIAEDGRRIDTAVIPATGAAQARTGVAALAPSATAVRRARRSAQPAQAQRQ